MTKYTIFMDLINKCNLKCPFCSNLSIEKKIFYKKPIVGMSLETFEKVLEIGKISRSINMSCVSEITTYSNFIDLIECMPQDIQEMAGFSTNLSIPLSDETLDRISKTKLKHVNVSIESFDKQKYEFFRKKAKYDIFIDNLDRLYKSFEKNNWNGPKLHFTSMLFKQNLEELTDLISICKDKYNADFHEIRTSFSFVYKDMDSKFVEESKILYKEANEFNKKLDRFNHVLFVNNILPDIQIDSQVINASLKPSMPRYNLIWIQSNGIIYHMDHRLYDMVYDLNNIKLNDVKEYFSDIIKGYEDKYNVK